MNNRLQNSHAGPDLKLPAIWTYRDARLYLRDAVDAHKRANAKFSYRQLSLEADLGSPNYIQAFLKGERQFKETTARSVARALRLDRSSADFFVLLVLFAQAGDQVERRQLYRAVLEASVKHGSGTIDLARLEYFSAWYVPVVHAMASLAGFSPDPDQIAKNIVPPIRKSEALKALEILSTLGILVVDPATGLFELREAELSTSADIRSVWIREYHLAMLRISDSALDRWSKEYRNVSSLTVTVAMEQIPWLVARIDQFRNELFAEILAGQSSDARVKGEVYQINLQAFPVTSFEAKPLAKHI